MTLQRFITGMITTPDDRLRAADIAKLAAKYEIGEDVAGFFLRMWLARA